MTEDGWKPLSAGVKVQRYYDWARLQEPPWNYVLLVRRSHMDHAEIAHFGTFGPMARTSVCLKIPLMHEPDLRIDAV